MVSSSAWNNSNDATARYLQYNLMGGDLKDNEKMKKKARLIFGSES